MYNPEDRNEETQFYGESFRVLPWFPILIFTIFVSKADANNLSNVIESTLPAYAIARRADVLPQSNPCREELKVFRDGVDNHTLWSLRMLDSSGQPRSGFMYGNNYWLGSKHQCYETTNPEPLALSPKILQNNSFYRNSGEELSPYPLNFFAVYIVHNSTFQYHGEQTGENLITLGLCLPATCSIRDLSEILEKIFDERILLIGYLNRMDFKLWQLKNLTDEGQHSSNWRMIVIGLLIILTALLIIVGTIYDICVHQKNLRLKDLCDENMNKDPKNHALKQSSATSTSRKATRILICFSAYTNSKDIFTIRNNKDSIEALHGIRVLGMAWMILLHVLLFGIEYMDNKIWAYRIAQTLPLQILSNGSVSVDTFFFMSGFLLAYTFFDSARKRTEDSKNVSWQIFYHRIIRRYIRLTPPYVMTIGIAEILFSWYGKTSQFYIHDKPHENCPRYWWRNIFYINNLFKRSEMCLYWSYYLSNDMQFFIIGSFLVFLSQRYHYTAVGIFIVLFIATTISVGSITYLVNYAPTVDEQLNTFEIFYDPPWMRIGPYLVGLAAAYILVVVMKKKMNVKKMTLWLLWFLGIACNVLILFGLYERRLSIITTSFYIALHRTIWGVGIAWLVVACYTGHGGIINKILSFKIWQPLSKLSYCAYLLNPVFIGVFHLSSESSFHVEYIPFVRVYMFLGVLVISYLGAYCLSMMFEIPFFLLANLYFEGRNNKKA